MSHASRVTKWWWHCLYIVLLFDDAYRNRVHCTLITYSNRTLLATNLSFVSDIVSDDIVHRHDVVVVGPNFLRLTNLPSREVISLPNQAGNEAVMTADLNGDGRMDIILTASRDFTFASVPGAIRWLENLGGGSFQSHILVSGGILTGVTNSLPDTHGRDLMVIDIDADGDPDIIASVSNSVFATPPRMGFILLLRNNGAATFQRTILLDDLLGPAVVDAADLNGDGKTDVVVLEVDIRPGSRRLRVLYGEGGGAYSVQTIDESAPGNMAIAIGDLNGDEYPDLITLGMRDLVVYYGSQTGQFTRHTLQSWNEIFQTISYRDWQLAAHDVDGDGMTDIVAVYGWKPGVQVFRQSSPGVFESPVTLVAADRAGNFFLKDLNDDDVADILVHSESQMSLYAYFAQGIFGGSNGNPPVPVPTNTIPTLSPTTSTPTSSPTGTFPTSTRTGNDVEETNDATLAPTSTPTHGPTSSPSRLPVEKSAAPTSTPTLHCIPLHQPCIETNECCNGGPNVYCSGKCKPRHPQSHKDGVEKLSADLLAIERGGVRRRRVLKGSRSPFEQWRQPR